MMKGVPSSIFMEAGGGGHLSGARWFSRGSPRGEGGRFESRGEPAMKQPQDLAFYIYSDLNLPFKKKYVKLD